MNLLSGGSFAYGIKSENVIALYKNSTSGSVRNVIILSSISLIVDLFDPIIIAFSNIHSIEYLGELLIVRNELDEEILLADTIVKSSSIMKFLENISKINKV